MKYRVELEYSRPAPNWGVYLYRQEPQEAGFWLWEQTWHYHSLWRAQRRVKRLLEKLAKTGTWYPT